MSFDDFCACDYDELSAISRSWGDWQRGLEQGAWERARTVASIVIAPHVTKRISPQKLLPLPWDKKQAPQKRGTNRLAKEEGGKSFNELVEEFRKYL